MEERLDLIVRLACEALEGGDGYDAASWAEALYIIHGLARHDFSVEQAEGYWVDWLSK